MKKTSFMIIMKNTQNGTWQGSIRWVEEKKEVSFRSALEMIKLIDSAIDEEIDDKYGRTQITFDREDA